MLLLKIYKELFEFKSNVHYVIAKKDVSIVSAIENADMEKMKFLGTGDRAYKKGMKKLKDDQYLYQIQIGINKTHVLYTYDTDGNVITGVPK